MMESNYELSSEHVYQLIDTANNSIFWKDKEGYIRGCNKFMLNIFGIKERNQIVGRTEYDFLSPQDADKVRKIDQQVLNGVSYQGEEYAEINGVNKVYFVSKSQLIDREGNVTGIIGTAIDITAEKEAQRLKLESERLKIVLQEKLVKIARKVAHDINSPLTSLKMILPACGVLPEVPRTILNQAIGSIVDIANNLFNTYKKDDDLMTSETDRRQPLLVSDLLVQLLSQKRVEYSNRSVKFETVIDHTAHFAFAQMQHSQFRRSMSNLINNAVDALDGKDNGVVTIKLAAYAEVLIVTIHDNGKGMSSGFVQKMLDRQSFTTGKENGHAIGLQQLWDTLDNNEGIMQVDSTEGAGTLIQLAFPRVKAASWLAHEIQPASNGSVVILDDDGSIHGAWDLRFKPLLCAQPALRLYHFSHGQETLDFFSTLSPVDKEHVLFLSDYELIGQDKNGLQIIEESGIKNTILVTSYYANPQIRDKATQLGIKILAKQMASIVPIEVGADFSMHTSTNNDGKDRKLRDSDFKDIDVVFIDDEEYLLNGFKFFAIGKKVDIYSDPALFLSNVDQYRKHTKIMLDQNFTNFDRKGIHIAEQLHAMGFSRLYLLSGGSFSKSDIPHYLTFIYKGELDNLKAALDE